MRCIIHSHTYRIWKSTNIRNRTKCKWATKMLAFRLLLLLLLITRRLLGDYIGYMIYDFYVHAECVRICVKGFNHMDRNTNKSVVGFWIYLYGLGNRFYCIAHSYANFYMAIYCSPVVLSLKETPAINVIIIYYFQSYGWYRCLFAKNSLFI